METGIGILCLVLVVAAYIAGRVGFAIENDRKKESDYDKMNEAIKAAMSEEDNQTRNLLIKTLEDIGCQPEIDEDNNVEFKYQGEEFEIDASNDNSIIWIYNIAWTGIKTNNTDADFLKQAINKANENSAITNLYTINEEKGFIAAHCQRMIYFAYNIPNYREYLKSILDGFFMAHQQVRFEFTNLAKIQEQKEKVEIKGFRSN